ncbi:MAG TPA: ERF family protein, partial [Terrimicrobiaceae bacterium]|nr:ERF family protein [Terrimicrobiaceae bacterium]
TTLRHSSGEVIISEWPLPANANPQNMGSNLTYAKRYSLAAICGVSADEDDDAEAGVKESGKAPKQTAAQRDATKPQAEAPKQAVTKLEPQAIERPEGSTATEWAGKFMQQIGLAKDEAEIIAWHKANSTSLSELHEKAVKVSERVIAFVNERKKQLAGANAG